MTLELRIVDQSQIEDMLPFVMPYIERAVAYDSVGTVTTSSVLHDCFAGRSSLWIIYDRLKRLVGAVVTRLVAINPEERVLEISQFAIDAPREEWVPLFDVLDEWAQRLDCAGIEMIGRRGWRKVLPDLGFKEVQTIMRRKVFYGQ